MRRPLLVLVFLQPGLLPGQAADLPRAAVVRGASSESLDARSRGEVLFGELGCGACHIEPDPVRRVAIPRRTAPDLRRVGQRVDPFYLERFLLDPHGVAPGTVMPDVLPGSTPAQRRTAASHLTHYLVSLTEQRFEREPVDQAAARRGHELFQSIGCVACHAPRNAQGVELPGRGPDAVPLGRLGAKYGAASLARFLTDPHAVRASGRMPNFGLEPGEARDLGHFLVGSDAAVREWKLDARSAALGRKLFSSSHCVRCHAIGDAAGEARTPLIRIERSRSGCLDPTSGDKNSFAGVPRYALAASQRADLARYLSDPTATTDEQATQVALARLDCLACHRRARPGRGVGHPRGGAGDHFRGQNQNLGPAGRLPPSLHRIGAKLQARWLTETVAYGQRSRPYLDTRMPGFGAANSKPLGEWLARVDAADAEPIAELPKGRKAAEAVRKLGRTLTGDRGMNCIACHTFRGKQAGAMEAIDLVETTGQRLRPAWFRSYLLDPAGIEPGTIMPLFFPGGRSIRSELADGDAERQIAGLWHYLAQGRNTREPPGLRPPPIELKVREEAVMLRRKAPGTGKRAIAVGYPGGVNLLFDAETLLIDRVWWGRFLDAAGVWTSQGHGNVRILERGVDRLIADPQSVPKARAPDQKFVPAPRVGPPFASRVGAAEPWPSGSRRDFGMEFLGYDLDARRRPTFRYRGSGLTVRDGLVERRGDALRAADLLRTIEFAPTPGGQPPAAVSVRLAVHAAIELAETGTARIGKRLRVRVVQGDLRVREAGRAKELIADVRLEGGRGRLVLEYSRGGEAR